MPLHQGQVIENRYCIVSLLDLRGYGAVCRPWDTRLEVPIALKEILDPSPEAQKQFGIEAKKSTKLFHSKRVDDLEYWHCGAPVSTYPTLFVLLSQGRWGVLVSRILDKHHDQGACDGRRWFNFPLKRSELDETRI